MPRISLTDFVDIAAKVGIQKANNVAQVKNREPYSPATDYWRKLRKHIAENHQAGGDKNMLLRANEITTNPNKQANYGILLSGYKRFWGRKNIAWFEPASVLWQSNGLEVSVNPELGLIIDGEYFLVKMYMKADALSKARLELTLFLMHQILPNRIDGHPITVGVLDVRNARLITPTGFNKNAAATLDAEAIYISTIWPSL